MHRIDSLRARLLKLESSVGYVILDDGTKFRPKDSGIRVLFNATKMRRDLGRAPLLSDFSEEDQEQLRCYAKWNPNPHEHGQLSVMVATIAREILDVASNPNTK